MNENEKLESERKVTEAATAQDNLLKGLKRLNGAYLLLVIFSVVIAATGIFVAIQFILWVGVAIAFVSALFYMIFSKLILKKHLAMSYQSISGAITVTKVYVKEQTELFIPRRIFWVNVTGIGDNAFVGERASLQSVHLPATLTEIGKDIFDGCEALKTVYFEGTQEEWEKIEKGTDFDGLEIVFCDTALYDKPKKKKSKKENKEAANDADAPTDTEGNV